MGATNAKKRMKRLVMSLLERLEQEEVMRKNSEQEMERIMIKLEVLQRSLMSEQSRVKTLLNNKDSIIRSLTKENRKLKKKIKGGSLHKSDSGDTTTSDSSFDSDKVGDGNDQSVMLIKDDQSSMIMMMPNDNNHQANDPRQDNTKEEEQNNNHHMDFVIVEDNLSEPKLVVLDKHDASDNVVVTTNDKSTVLQISQTRAALRQMTNHRSATKPSDIKHRDSLKTVTKEHRTMLSYWSDSFL